MAAQWGQRVAAANTNLSHHCGYCGKKEKLKKFRQCSGCKSTRYCSEKCQRHHWVNHKPLCNCIQDLSQSQKVGIKGKGDSSDPDAYPSHLNPKQKTAIAGLVGKRCTLTCKLENENFEVLWDTGAQVSLISEQTIEKYFPYLEIKNISELLNPNDDLDLLATNGTAIPYKGWAEIDLNIDPTRENSEFQTCVPFLVTPETLDYPIVGYNVIQEIIDRDSEESSVNSSNIVDCLKASFVSEVKTDKVNMLANLIKCSKSAEFCQVKTVKKNVIIPKKSAVKVTCKANTGTQPAKIPVLFEPEETEPWPSGLSVSETLLTVKGGNSCQFKLDVVNETEHDIVLGKRTCLGRLELVRSVTPVDIHFKPFPGENKENQNEESKSNLELPDSVRVKVDKTSSVPDQDTVDSIDLDFSEIDFDGLTADQKEQAIKMLREESDSCAKSDDDIGAAPDLTLDIKLSDQTPVQKSYLSIPHPLYNEVKNYIEDLLNRNFIAKLSSPYFSSVVCVRKKDGSLRLCIDYRGLNAKTIPDRHPILRVQEMLDNLGGQLLVFRLRPGQSILSRFLN